MAEKTLTDPLAGLSPLGRELVSGISAAAMAVAQRDQEIDTLRATVEGLEARITGLEAQLQAARSDADRMRTAGALTMPAGAVTFVGQATVNGAED